MSSSLSEHAQDSVLFDLCSHAQQRLALLLQRMFDQLDDVLFELADQSHNHAQQNLYFESMRDIRIKRRPIEQGFTQAIEGYFATLIDETPPYDLNQKQAALLTDQQGDELQPSAFTQSDDKLMLDAMIAKALSRYPLALAQLTARLDSLIAFKLESKQNPIGPHLVTQAFFFASRHLNIGAKAKSIYFTAFDRCVLESLGDVTTLCNTILFEQDVLPHLPVDQLNQTSMYDHVDASSEQHGVSVESLLKEATDLVEGTEPSSIQPALPQKGGEFDREFMVIRPLGQGSVLERETIIAVLCEIQQQQYQQWQPVLNREQMESLPEFGQVDITHLIDQIMAAQNANTPVCLDALDAELINLVKMLFQFVIEDNNLSPVIKSLIACLYVPIIKVALLDPSFFNQSGHPARQLLNEVSTAALGWNPVSLEQRDPLAQEVIELIHTILSRFDKDVGLFNQALEGFKTFLEIDSRNTTLLEQRLVDAEGGKAKSENTRNKVQNLIDRTLETQSPPEVVERFLRSMWSNVLFVSRLKYGKQSVEFAFAVETMDRLLWSVGPAENFVSRQELLSKLPALLKDLREKLTEIDINTLDQNHFFAELEAIHLSRIKSAGAGSVEQKSQAEAQPEVTADDSETDAVEFDGALDEVAVALDPANSKAEPLENRHANQVPSSEQESQPVDDLQPVEVSEEALNQVNAIVVGGWVDFIEDDKRTRCRLAAKIKPTGMFLFVNRRGQKMAEYSANELAHLVQKKQIDILDDGLLFDRALASVIGGLRR